MQLTRLLHALRHQNIEVPVEINRFAGNEFLKATVHHMSTGLERGMDRQWHIEFLRLGPQDIVIGVAGGFLGPGEGRDKSSLGPQLHCTIELFGGFFSIAR